MFGVMSMSQMVGTSLLTTLTGTDCSWCATGTLERATFKDNQALVCEDCGTPSVQLW